jgi:class 3 adenylate cyclase
MLIGETWRRLRTALGDAWRGTRVAEGDLAEFRSELARSAAERMRAFAWLLLVLHAALLVRDVSIAPSALPANERLWLDWLFRLHVAMALGTSTTLLLLRTAKTPRNESRAAFAFMLFLLVWSGWLSGVDQLIGAGITPFLIVNISCALFVTFDRSPTAQAFALGLISFVAGQLWFSPRPALAFSQLVNGTAFALTCWVFSRMLHATKARDFMQRVTIARQHAELEEAHRVLAAERERSERVLYAVLPHRIAERLRQGESPIADVHPQLTILLADLTSFTRLAAELPASEVIDILNDLFSRFDEVATTYRLEKIKTVGDAYLAARGLEAPSDDDASAAADAALAMQQAVLQVARKRQRALGLRVGIAHGEAMSGVLGRERLFYDLWGDAVNVASRLETAALPGEILVTQELGRLLEATHELGPVRVRDLKGKGATATCSVLGVRERAQEGLTRALRDSSRSPTSRRC